MVFKKILLIGVGKDVLDLRDDQALCGKGYGRCGTRNTKDDFSFHGSCNGPGEHRGSPDLLETLEPEEFAKTINLLFEQGCDGFNRAVIVSQPGTAVDNDTVAGF